MAFYRPAAHSRTCFCLNQGLIYLLAVLNWSYCDLHKILEFFEVCAHGRIFSSSPPPQMNILVLVYCQIYISIFTVSLPNCILLSPLYANALPGCLYYHLSIYLLSLCDLQCSLAFCSQITFCLLSTPDDPFIAQLCFTISPDNASCFLTVPYLLFLCCSLPLAVHFSPTRLVLMLTQLHQLFCLVLYHLSSLPG